MTASKRVYEPVAASLRLVYRQAVEMYAEGRKDEAVTLYNALTGIVGDVKSAFAVTRDSYIDLYKSWYDGLEWLVDDQPYARIVFGPRGGRRVQSF